MKIKISKREKKGVIKRNLKFRNYKRCLKVNWKYNNLFRKGKKMMLIALSKIKKNL